LDYFAIFSAVSHVALQAGFGRSALIGQNFGGPHVWQNKTTFRGLLKKAVQQGRRTLQVLKKFVQQGHSDESTGGVASGLR
jgi:hypothetical protein